MDSLKEKLRKRELTIGSWITFSDPSIAEIMACSGFDWLTIDMEHSGLSMGQALELIRVIDLCGVSPFVRVGENHPYLIKRFMDMGAHGIIVPMVNSRDDALKAASAVKYPPLGIRGVGLSRAQKYSLDFERYRRWNHENSIVIVQVEHIDAVNNLEDIMSVHGVDGFIIGPYDLSGSLGRPGDLDHPEVQGALNLICEKSRKHNYLSGLHIVQPITETLKEKIAEGVRFIGFGTDFLFLGEHLRNAFKQITGIREQCPIPSGNGNNL